MKRRWLLYDSGCSACAALAREVEALSGGRLGVRSLREPEVQALLNRARPGWRWEPMLLEVDGEQVRVYAGLAMRMWLLRVLGPVRAWRVAQAVARLGGPVLGVDWGRRRLLQQGGALAGLVLLGRWFLFRSQPASAASSSELEGEVWEGFLLLPAGAPLPAWVQCAPAPILGEAEGPGAEDLRGETRAYERWEDLRPLLQFPLYVPSILPPGFQLLGAYLTVFRKSGEVFSASLAFGDARGEPLIQVIAQPIYPKPYPVWPVYFPWAPETPIPPEKVFFTPTPGLLLPSLRGYNTLWIADGVLYLLITVHDRRREGIVQLAQSLQRVPK
ncbi:MAG TPA: hypothetical protein VNK89_07270 [Thermoflexus sp.]|nr:hypothetical protein [Thermoflexus sp.]